MLRRKIADEADARRCLEAVAASGLPRREWALAHGVDGRSLNAWRLNVARGRRDSPVTPGSLRLVELVAHRDAGPARYVIRHGDFAVEVDDRFDDGHLRRLLAVVAGC